jgi:hypothetical protein
MSLKHTAHMESSVATASVVATAAVASFAAAASVAVVAISAVGFEKKINSFYAVLAYKFTLRGLTAVTRAGHNLRR